MTLAALPSESTSLQGCEGDAGQRTTWASDRLIAQTEASLGAKDVTAGGNDQETKRQVQLPRIKLTASVKGPRGGGGYLSPDQESLHHSSRSRVADIVCNTVCRCATFLGVQTLFIRKWKQSKTSQQEQFLFPRAGCKVHEKPPRGLLCSP